MSTVKFTPLAFFSALAIASTAMAAELSISKEEARSIGVEAYHYFYPLVTMDLTRKQAVNVQAGNKLGKAPMNTFVHAPAYPPADFKAVVRPNFDTLYSSVWLDLTKEPVVLSVPDTQGRFYLMPMLDMWSDVFASPGLRTTGTQAGNFLIAPTGWKGNVPEGFTRIDAPTPHVWIIGRTQTNGPADYDAVHKIQAGYKITLLSGWGKKAALQSVEIDPTVDMKTPPKIQVDMMPADKYFSYAAELLKLHPPHITDQPISARIKRIGIEAGKSFDITKLDPAVREALLAAPTEALEVMRWKAPTLARVANGWAMNTDTTGVYGNYYLKRAMIAQGGLGANLPEDAIYPSNLFDDSGKPLEGTHSYTLHFSKETTPPVSGFWSVTLYDKEGFQVGNPLNRFALSSWMPFQFNLDGSLDLYFQNESPGKDKETNWLPAPKGSFNICMRLYGPKAEALNGKWSPPPVVRVNGPSVLEAQ